METTRTPITPVRQAFVEIAGHRILAFVLPGNQIAAGFRMICNILGVSHRTQFRSVRADPALSDLLLLVKIDIMGTPQEMNVIVAEAIPMWLASIHESKVSPEARETLAEFQRVAVQTLRAFFFPETKAQPQAAPPKEEPTQSALPQPEPFPPLGDEARYEYQGYMFQAHDGLERHLRAIDARQLTLTRQMTEVRQVLNQHAAILNKHTEALDAFQKRAEAWMVQAQQYFDEYAEVLNQQTQALNQHAEALRQLRQELSALAARVTRLETSGPLAAEHLGEARALTQVLGHQTGQPASALERELAAAFGVEVLEQLPEARWGEIAAWLHQRLGW